MIIANLSDKAPRTTSGDRASTDVGSRASPHAMYPYGGVGSALRVTVQVDNDVGYKISDTANQRFLRHDRKQLPLKVAWDSISLRS